MGLLDGGLAPLINSVFGGLLLGGTLHRRVLTSNGKGGFTAADDTPVPIRTMVEPASKEMRATDGFQQKDVGLLILAQGVPFPDEKDEVSVLEGPNAGRYLLLNPIGMDAAGTHYTARGRLK